MPGRIGIVGIVTVRRLAATILGGPTNHTPRRSRVAWRRVILVAPQCPFLQPPACSRIHSHQFIAAPEPNYREPKTPAPAFIASTGTHQ